MISQRSCRIKNMKQLFSVHAVFWSKASVDVEVHLAVLLSMHLVEWKQNNHATSKISSHLQDFWGSKVMKFALLQSIHINRPAYIHLEELAAPRRHTRGYKQPCFAFGVLFIPPFEPNGADSKAKYVNGVAPKRMVSVRWSDFLKPYSLFKGRKMLAYSMSSYEVLKYNKETLLNETRQNQPSLQLRYGIIEHTVVNMPFSQKFYVNWRFFAYFLIVPITTFYSESLLGSRENVTNIQPALVLTGCVTNSPGLPNLHFLNLHLPATNPPTSTDLRVGYFGEFGDIDTLSLKANTREGICINSSSGFVCSTTHGMKASDLASKFRNTTTPLPSVNVSEGLIEFAMTLQGNIFPPLLAGAGAIFALGVFFFVMLQRDVRVGDQVIRGMSNKKLSPERTERYRKGATVSFYISLGLALASAMAVAQTAAGIQFTLQAIEGQTSETLRNPDNLFLTGKGLPTISSITAGKPNQILQWFIVACSAIFSIGIGQIFDEPFFKVARNPYMKDLPAIPLQGPPPMAGGPLPGVVGPPPPPMPPLPPPLPPPV
ncbi:uncharacterized protein BDR25DRAFT_362370 [Lindgomyces ingoldianus]|uniref:Uncharacterized protein n=1 Tax=Lindgomyces ingoldianus TaxID=673940 RepID=A0ACB6QCE7_9PLEO|nr:uncharacterized protein BDR25DRAFT_362370 [Lindgomyces ingoldianus]KAF2463821.1 hypothetical protein BDR25DRAFT_362370 [Lindgomyces ingoldianus]